MNFKKFKFKIELELSASEINFVRVNHLINVAWEYLAVKDDEKYFDYLEDVESLLKRMKKSKIICGGSL